MAELPFIVERCTIIKFKIAEVGYIGVTDQKVDRVGCPLQAVSFGEAIFIRRKVGHVVFDLVENRREQDTDRKSNECERNEQGDKPGEEHRILHESDCKPYLGMI